MQQTAARADLTIAVYDSPGGKPRVEPGVALLPKGTTVAWQNVTNGSVEVTFPGPAREIFDPPTSSLNLKPAETSDCLLVSEDTHLGAFLYNVLVDRGEGVTAQFAEGASPPRMIVIE